MTATFWMIGGDGGEYGPVSEDQLREWIQENRANAETRVRRDPTADWQPLAAFPEFAEALAEHGAQGAPPPPLLPGESPPSPAWSGAGGPALDIGGCLGRAWSVLTRHFLVITGSCAMVWGLLLAVRMLTCVGPIISLVLTGPLYAGLSLVVLRLVRGQTARPGEVFAFFGPLFMPLMLLGIVVETGTGIGLLFCLVPGLVLKVLWVFAYVAASERPQGFWDAMEASRRAVMPRFVPLTGLLLLCWLPTVVFLIYAFTVQAGYAADMLQNSGLFDFDYAKFEELARRTAPLALQQTVVMLLNMPFALTVTVQAYEDLVGPASPPSSR